VKKKPGQNGKKIPGTSEVQVIQRSNSGLFSLQQRLAGTSPPLTSHMKSSSPAARADSPSLELDGDSKEDGADKNKPTVTSKRESVADFAHDLTKFNSGKYGIHIQKMMEAALRGEDYEIPKEVLVTYMDEPVIGRETATPAPILHIESAPADRSAPETLNQMTINSFFPDKVVPPKKECHLDDELEIDAMIELVPLLPTPAEIRALPFSPLEIRKVKNLNLFQADISDLQLGALVEQFPHLETVTLTMCPELTDAGIGALSRLISLKSVDIRYCPKITQRGIAELPLDVLEHFGISTNERIDASIIGKLVTSPELRRASFILCPHLQPEALLSLSQAHQSFQITESVKGCDQILASTIEHINKERNKQPIFFRFGAADILDLSGRDGISRKAQIPPQIPQADDILSDDSVQDVYDKETLPHFSVIAEHDYNKKRPQFKGFRGLDLSRGLSNDALSALVGRFPEMEIVRILKDEALSSLGMIKQLAQARTLYMGQLPGVSGRMVELLFKQSVNAPVLQNLADVHLFAMQVSDEALKNLALLPRLRTLTLASCDSFTVQGLRHLMNGCPSLESLTVVDCPGVDLFAFDEFQAARPRIELVEDSSVDAPAVRWAMEETDRIMWSPVVKRSFFFLRELMNTRDPIPENTKIHLEPEIVSRFYIKQLARIGVKMDIDDKTDLATQWMRADQILQAYMNVHRIAWALRKELIRVGFFLNVEQQFPPTTVRDILSYINFKNETDVYTYRRKVKLLDFSQLGLTHIHELLELSGHWEQVEKIQLDGNYVEGASKNLVSLCPNLLQEEEFSLPEIADSKEAAPPSQIKKGWSLLPKFLRKKTDP